MSFLAGWLVGELALHHIAWQMLATLVFVWKGALEAVLAGVERFLAVVYTRYLLERETLAAASAAG